MPAIIIKPIQIKSFKEENGISIPWIKGLELDPDYDADKYLFGYWKPTGNEDEYEIIEGAYEKYDYKIINKWYDSVGELYIYKMEDKKLALFELNDFLNKEIDTPSFVREWLTKLKYLVEKSIELSESTIIIEYEV